MLLILSTNRRLSRTSAASRLASRYFSNLPSRISYFVVRHVNRGKGSAFFVFTNRKQLNLAAAHVEAFEGKREFRLAFEGQGKPW